MQLRREGKRSWRSFWRRAMVWFCAALLFAPEDVRPVLNPFVPGEAQAQEAEERSSSRRLRSKRRKERTSRRQKTSTGVLDGSVPIGGEASVSHDSFAADSGAGIPLDVVLLLDGSGSMQRTDPTRLRDQGAKLFLRFLAPGDRLAVYEFHQEAKQLSDLELVQQENLAKLDQAIESVTVEGRFTDLLLPVEKAFSLLKTKGRNNAKKVIILLSDGKMDPQPSKGTAADFTQKLLNDVLPQFRDQGVRLYTLSLSAAADRDLLGEMARATDGLHSFTPDIESVHQRFSDLFLVLKQPQTVAIDKNGFEIDATVDEATFYVSRPKELRDVVLVDPLGKKMTSVSLPFGIKWFKGERFDIITIKKPMAGVWLVEGIDEPKGFATLLTDVNLEVRWPSSNVRVGDEVLVMARLVEGEKVISTPGFGDVVFMRYKILNNQTGQTVYSGSFNDKGVKGDQQKDDGIYSTILKIAEEGEYKALIGVTSPTFTRQQQFPFQAGKSEISLTLEEADDFAKTPQRFRLVVSSSMMSLSKRKIQLVAQQKGGEQATTIELSPIEGAEGEFQAATSLAPAGEFEIFGRVVGFEGRGKKKKRVESRSEVITFTGEASDDPDAVDGIDDLVLEDEIEPEDNTILFIVSLVISLCWSGGLFWYGLSRSKMGEAKFASRKPYVVPQELTEKLDALRERSSETKREPNEIDAALKDPEKALAVSFEAEQVSATPAAPAEEEEREELIPGPEAGGDTEIPAEEETQAEGESEEEKPPTEEGGG